jgi:hypothetical protein
LLDVEIKIKRQWYRDQINDAENMTAAKRKKPLPIRKRIQGFAKYQEKELQSQKKDEVGGVHQDIDEKK